MNGTISSRSYAALWVLVILAIGWIAEKELRRGIEALNAPKVSVQDGRAFFSGMSDGPFVFTHLISYGDGTGTQRMAALTPPAAYIDSEGTSVALKGLVWRDFRGEVSDEPDHAGIRALYHIPLRTEIRTTDR